MNCSISQHPRSDGPNHPPILPPHTQPPTWAHNGNPHRSTHKSHEAARTLCAFSAASRARYDACFSLSLFSDHPSPWLRVVPSNSMIALLSLDLYKIGIFRTYGRLRTQRDSLAYAVNSELYGFYGRLRVVDQLVGASVPASALYKPAKITPSPLFFAPPIDQ